MQISPISPWGSTFSGSSMEQMSTTVPGTGTPSEPSRLPPGVVGLQVATGAVSLSP